MHIIDSFFSSLYQNFGGTDFASVLMKLFVATVLSGVIGLERDAHRQTAGFRTYILVSLGSCVAMMTDQFICEYLNTNADPARLGAQVITGVGFLGAGTILLAGRQVIGLTTAAGLWASACIGLSVGVGFYSVALVSSIILFITLEILPFVESAVDANARTSYYHIELANAANFMEFQNYIKDTGVEIKKIYVSKTPSLVKGGISFRLLANRRNRMSQNDFTEYLEHFDDVYLVEEL